ncbi:hypothetical protein CANCADRAFT_1799 [Tortispora caseinolytica NRRL Y-17796]|uniref:Zn(2)-C6 fungal-type domain-containing protein n=1 Tax=Tortispora caseinolytica NRRL Y-17796 TaxID=767744 RepID=A0A1E4TE67_9ASCO|nr:hypothetical protein CANCADRAFT_1799 [Tortispora caseinolytica NRRL Y-17796]
MHRGSHPAPLNSSGSRYRSSSRQQQPQDIHKHKKSPASPVRNIRKTHRKSRKGCERCKKRRIKCSEDYPECKNCKKYDQPCDYLQLPPEELEQRMSRKAIVETMSKYILRIQYFIEHPLTFLYSNDILPDECSPYRPNSFITCTIDNEEEFKADWAASVLSCCLSGANEALVYLLLAYSSQHTFSDAERTPQSLAFQYQMQFFALNGIAELFTRVISVDQANSYEFESLQNLAVILYSSLLTERNISHTTSDSPPVVTNPKELTEEIVHASSSPVRDVESYANLLDDLPASYLADILHETSNHYGLSLNQSQRYEINTNYDEIQTTRNISRPQHMPTEAERSTWHYTGRTDTAFSLNPYTDLAADQEYVHAKQPELPETMVNPSTFTAVQPPTGIFYYPRERPSGQEDSAMQKQLEHTASYIPTSATTLSVTTSSGSACDEFHGPEQDQYNFSRQNSDKPGERPSLIAQGCVPRQPAILKEEHRGHEFLTKPENFALDVSEDSVLAIFDLLVYLNELADRYVGKGRLASELCRYLVWKACNEPAAMSPLDYAN